MAQRDREVPHLEQVEGGARAKHRRTGDIQFGTLHVLPTLLSTPNSHALFFCICSCFMERQGDCQDHLRRRKLRASEEGRGLRLKTNGGQAVCAPKREQRQANDGA